MPLAMCIPTGAVAQWYTYSPGLSALNVNCEACPGAVKLLAAPPPGPVTACRSMLWGILLDGWFWRWNSTVSPWRMRINLPGTSPPKVQKV